MNAADTIAHLMDHFTLVRTGADPEGALEYDFEGNFEFTATEVDETTLRLTAAMPDLNGVSTLGISQALLASNLQGVETGAGQIGLHPTLGLGLIEVIDCATTDMDGFEQRFVNFALYAEYWRSERTPELLAVAEGSSQTPEPEMMLRL